MRVRELFDVRYGHSLELIRLARISSERGIAFVSRKMGDNGVSAFVAPVDGLEPASPGELSCALGGNGVLSTFLQERRFYTGRDVAILSPRRPLTKAVLLYYAMCIKANRYRYSYGRQANRTLKEIDLPSIEAIPKWVQEVDVGCFVGADAAYNDDPSKLPPLKAWREYQLDNLFAIKKGKRLTKANMTTGSTPFIGAIDNHNGLTAFIGQPAIHKANTITVNYNGNGVAEAFYQPTPFWCSDDVNVLYPKFKLVPGIALFIATVIRLERYRFNYGRKWHLERMRTALIRLPATADGKPDWEYMERYILSLPFSKQIEQGVPTP
jgi:hypothetical protein